ncbi:MAG TPA: hypothetical protein VLL52_11385 [Anaerolineae bacterium]|nr:hypothetical protein [Anaerolineae bacterium]
MRTTRFLILIIISTLLTACGQQATPSRTFTTGDTLLNEQFDSPDAWEAFADEEIGFTIESTDGAYHITNEAEAFIWGLNHDLHTDAVFELTTNQLSDANGSAYGLICRANPDNNGDGYYFLISDDRYFTIAKAQGEEITPLKPWEYAATINNDPLTNTLKAVCIDDYLALYINDQFVMEATDETFTEGFTGLAGAPNPENNGRLHVTFDNLTITSATLTGEETP